VVRVGTRGSPLALWQAEHVRELLARHRPELSCEIVVITTTGDQILDTPLPAIGGKGVFTAELEQALHERSIDLAVHSLKDLPTAASPGLAVGTVLQRADSADALVSRNGHSVRSLPNGAHVGTSSSRRAAQLLHARPDLQLIDLRGNAGTRLRKALDPLGPYDAIVVALAALQRLGRMEVVSEIIPEDMMLPAPGQGAIGVQCRDEEDAFELRLRGARGGAGPPGHGWPASSQGTGRGPGWFDASERGDE
jgi:hydroxymethylbilane synthase